MLVLIVIVDRQAIIAIMTAWILMPYLHFFSKRLLLLMLLLLLTLQQLSHITPFAAASIVADTDDNDQVWANPYRTYAEVMSAVAEDKFTFVSRKELARHDGKVPGLALWMSVRGIVFDVTTGKRKSS